MCIDLAHIVKVSVRHALEEIRLAILVQQLVQIPLALEVLESAPCKRFGRAIRRDAAQHIQVMEPLVARRHMRQTRLVRPHLKHAVDQAELHIGALDAVLGRQVNVLHAKLTRHATTALK